ncbi:glycerophosphoryl diester phosphodiesterase [Bosea sp. 124]|nr:glycerophosphoryl diester phosphodiesterase [Bosea sp. 124]
MSLAQHLAGQPRPLAIAHRGGALLGPENTAATFRAAASAGAALVETDVRLSADGALVCLHDADLTRVTGDPRRVAELDLATLRRLLPGLMTLDEAIAASQPLGLLLDVKLSDAVVLRAILARIDAAGAGARVLLGLRSLPLVAAARHVAPDIAILALAGDPCSAPEARRAGAGWFRLWEADATDARVAAVRAEGLMLVVMVGQPRDSALPEHPPFPVGQIDAAGIAALMRLSPDAVMLDDPRLLIAAREAAAPVTALSSS